MARTYAVPIEVRKTTLARILRKNRTGVRLNEHMEHPREQSCSSTPARWGWRGWLKFKNPEAPAVKREAEEEWGQ
jgi:hypothetical protein